MFAVMRVNKPILLALLLAVLVSAAPAQQVEIPKEATNKELLEAANAAWAAKNYEAGKQLFQELVRRDPKHPTAWAGLGWMLFYTNAPPKDFEAAFRKQIEIDPFHPSAYLGLSDALAQQGKSAESEAMVKKQLEIAPLDFDSHRALGMLYAQQHRYKEAIAELETALRIQPDSIQIKYLLAFAYYSSGEREKAEALQREAAHDAPPQLQAHVVERYDPYQAMFADLDLPDSGQSAPRSVGYGSASSVSEPLVSPAVRYDADLALAQARQKRISEWLMNAEPGPAGARQQAMTTELAVAWAQVGALWLHKGDLANAARYLHASWLLTFASPVAGQLARIYEKQRKWSEAYLLYTLYRQGHPMQRLIKKEDDPEAIGRRLRKHLSDAEFARIMKKSNFTSDARTVFLDHLARKKQSSAEFGVSFVGDGHGGAALEKLTPVNGDASLQRYEAKLKEGKFNLEFPDDTPARIIRHGWIFCGMGGCSFTLDMLPAPLSPEEKKMNGME